MQDARYTNLWCNHGSVCPVEGRIQPCRHVNNTAAIDRDAAADLAWLDAWPLLFSSRDIPAELAAPCCAQFAVIQQQVLKRSKPEYEHSHTWLVEAKMSDDISGRKLEYVDYLAFPRPT